MPSTFTPSITDTIIISSLNLPFNELNTLSSFILPLQDICLQIIYINLFHMPFRILPSFKNVDAIFVVLLSPSQPLYSEILDFCLCINPCFHSLSTTLQNSVSATRFLATRLHLLLHCWWMCWEVKSLQFLCIQAQKTPESISELWLLTDIFRGR